MLKHNIYKKKLLIIPSFYVINIIPNQQLYGWIFSYFPPLAPGYGTEANNTSLEDYEYPNGRIWKPLFETGRYVDPSLKQKKFSPN